MRGSESGEKSSTPRSSAEHKTRLTLQYSGLLVLFLILFITIVLCMLYYILINDPKRQINALADEEISAISGYSRRTRTYNNPAKQTAPVYFTIGQNQFFYYWVDAAGTLKFGEELQAEVRDELLVWLSGWHPAPGEVRISNLHLRDNHRKFGDRFHPEQMQRIKLIAAGRSLYMKNNADRHPVYRQRCILSAKALSMVASRSSGAWSPLLPAGRILQLYHVQTGDDSYHPLLQPTARVCGRCFS